MSSQLPSTPVSTPRRRAERGFYLVLAAVGAFGAVGVIVSVAVPAVPARPVPNTVWYEVLKTSLQVLGVVLVGAFVGMAVFKLQQVQLDESKLHAEEREHNRIKDRRATDHDIDALRRLDDRTQSFLSETIDAYHSTKQIRRQLEAATPDGVTTSELPEGASNLLMKLSNQQLAFESLKRRSPLLEELLDG